MVISGFDREPLAIARDGTVLAPFRRRQGSVVVRVSPPGATARAMVRAPWADLSHGDLSGLDGTAVRALIESIAAAGPAAFGVALPHLTAPEGPPVVGRISAAELLALARGQGLEVDRAESNDGAIHLHGKGIELCVGAAGGGLRVGRGLFVATRVAGDVAVGHASSLAAALMAVGAGGRTIEAGGIDERALAAHLFALRASGFTRIERAIDPGLLDGLRDAAERALERARDVERTSGRLLPRTIVEVHDPATFLLNRALYCWSPACVELLESPWIERIADALIGPHRLHELAAQGAVPAPQLDPLRAERWHRDQDLETAPGPNDVRFLWFMVPVDPFTAENGATWIVPGSHRLPDRDTPVGGEGVVRFPTARQITSEPGDLVIVNPLALHTWGHNRTARPRRMINAMIAAPNERTVLDHWELAGPTLRATASGRVRYLLRSLEPSLEPAWPALPPGWAT